MLWCICPMSWCTCPVSWCTCPVSWCTCPLFSLSSPCSRIAASLSTRDFCSAAIFSTCCDWHRFSCPCQHRNAFNERTPSLYGYIYICPLPHLHTLFPLLPIPNTQTWETYIYTSNPSVEHTSPCQQLISPKDFFFYKTYIYVCFSPKLPMSAVMLASAQFRT